MIENRFEIEIIESDIQTDLLNRIVSRSGGANILFFGTVRETTQDTRTDWLEYDCYQKMADTELVAIANSAGIKWPIEKCLIIHRMGRVEVGQPSIAVGVSTPHRKDAFDAAQWIMDSIKKSVPIWKKECVTGQPGVWQHHGERPSTAADESVLPASHPNAHDSKHPAKHSRPSHI